MLLNRDLETVTREIAKAMYDQARLKGRATIIADRFVRIDEQVYDCRPLAAAALEKGLLV